MGVMKAHHDLALGGGVPHTNDTRISADEEGAAGLLPVGDQSTAPLDLQHFVQAPERADHLHRTME